MGVGFDVSLAQAIADKLGVELVTSEMAFDSLIPAVQAGTVDIAASITPTEERKQAVDFSDNYYDTTNVFVVRKGEEGNFTAKESFDGKTIGAQMGTAQNTLVVEDMTNAQSLLLPKTTTLIQELNTGNIDAICLEKPVADIYVAAYSDDLAVCSYEVPVEEGGVAIPVAKGQEDPAQLHQRGHRRDEGQRRDGAHLSGGLHPGHRPDRRRIKKSPVSLSLAQQTTRIGGKR